MADLGEDATQYGNRILTEALRHFLRKMEYRNNHEEVSHTQGVSEKSDDVTFTFSTAEARNEMARFLEEHGFHPGCPTAPSAQNQLIIRQEELKDISEYARNVLSREDSSALKEKDLTSKIVDDPIKSHDGMDIDTRTSVVETTGFQWKEDLAARVAQARDIAATKGDFIKQLQRRGVILDTARDGETLYRDAQQPYHNLRGNTLGERFTQSAIDKIRQQSLKDRAVNATNLSHEIAKDAIDKTLEHTVPTR